MYRKHYTFFFGDFFFLPTCDVGACMGHCVLLPRWKVSNRNYMDPGHPWPLQGSQWFCSISVKLRGLLLPQAGWFYFQFSAALCLSQAWVSEIRRRRVLIPNITESLCHSVVEYSSPWQHILGSWCYLFPSDLLSPVRTGIKHELCQEEWRPYVVLIHIHWAHVHLQSTSLYILKSLGSQAIARQRRHDYLHFKDRESSA